MSSPRSVIIGQSDSNRLEALLRSGNGDNYDLLFDELDAATIVPSSEVPEDVVTMNSKISFVDMDTNVTSVIRLVYPDEVKGEATNVSILAPVGAALIGLHIGETIEWPLPGGKVRRLQVVAVDKA